jgi:hypothetical protein
MKNHELEHYNFFEKELQKRKIAPTNFFLCGIYWV